jgi:alanyl aminopeptidase
MRAFVIALACSGVACLPPPATTTPPPTPPAVTITPPPPKVVTPPAADKGFEPAEPALRLPKNFVPVAYRARLAIDPKKATFEGSIAISGKLDKRSSVIWLHGRKLTIQRATAAATKGDPLETPNGIASALTVTPHGEDLLEVRAEPPLDPGTWQLAFDYTGQIDDNNTTGAFGETVNGLRYIYTQFEAIYARRVFPCVDEPDSKVSWQLTLDVPREQVAVSNTPEVKTTPLEAGWKRVEFAPTKPLPSYLIAFGVGPFDVIDAGKTKSGIPVRIVTLKGRAADAGWAVKTTPHVLELLEEWFGTPYPYEKLDMLTIPTTVGFGAMENAGLVTYAERGMLFDQAHPSWDHKHRWINGASHELAHQWFGDYVTTAWWDDIWLNEGFANWMETKILARFDPGWHDEQDELGMRIWALESDSATSARKIRQPIEATDDILNAFDGITYDKGASILNMFEAYVGADAFQKGVRAYMQARAFGNATSADFIQAISAASGKDLGPAFSTFLDQGGAPELDATLACDKGAPRAVISQHRYVPPGSPVPPEGKPWILPVCVAYERGGKRAEACTLVDKPSAEIALDTKTCPRWLWPNVGAHGYYRSRYAATQVTALRDEAWPLLTGTERRSLYFDVAAAVYNRPPTKLPLALALSLVPKMLSGGDRFLIGDALGVPLGLDWFVADDQRSKYETWLRTEFGPGAAQVGALPKDSDDLDAETIRVRLYSAAAWSGRDPDLAKQAIELSEHWRDLPLAMRPHILGVAVDASPEVFARVLADVRKETDREKRAEMLNAIAATHDPKHHEAALPLVLDPALDVRDFDGLLWGWPNEASRAVAEKFLRENEKALLARLPQDEVTGSVAGLAGVFTSACDAKRRDEIADYVTKHYAGVAGGDRIVKQAIEGMDQCIASRAMIEPEIRAFLGGWKPPRVDAKKGKTQTKTKPK